MNVVNLLGGLASDPELKVTPNGTNVATFSIAVDRGTKDTSGNRESDFFNCVAWNHNATFASKYFHKGDGIGVEGRLQSRKYEAKDGSMRYITEVVVNKMHFPRGKKKTEDNPMHNNPYAPQPTPHQPQRHTFQADEYSHSTVEEYIPLPPADDDDLPFE